MMSSMSCSLIQLPLEIFLEIVKWCMVPPRACSVAELQLICKSFLQTVNLLPRIAFHLGCSHSSQKNAAQQIRDLALGRSTVDVASVKQLCIDYHSLFDTDDRARVLSSLEKTVLEHLPNALRSLVNVKRVSVIISNSEPHYLVHQILRGLKHMSSLRHVTLTGELLRSRDYRTTPDPIDLTALSNLESFTLISTLDVDNAASGIARLLDRCPGLTYLHLETNATLDLIFGHLLGASCPSVLKLKHFTVRLAQVTAPVLESCLRHLISLESLGLYVNRHVGRTGEEDIWDPFRRAKVFIRNIATNLFYDRSLKPYITAMAPRRPKLSVEWLPSNDENNRGRVLATLHESCVDAMSRGRLKLYAGLLVELRLDLIFPWKWPFNHATEVFSTLALFRCLKRIHIRTTIYVAGTNWDKFCNDCMQSSIVSSIALATSVIQTNDVPGKTELIEFCSEEYPVLEELHLSHEKSSLHPYTSQHDYFPPHIVAPHLATSPHMIYHTEQAILNFVIPASRGQHFDIIHCGTLYEAVRDPETMIYSYVKSRNMHSALHL